MSVALHPHRRRALLHSLHSVLHLMDQSYSGELWYIFIDHMDCGYFEETVAFWISFNLVKSALGAPNGDITVVLVPEHHQAHKELCNDKQKLGENLIQ